MRQDVLDMLVCPECGEHPLRYESFAMSGKDDILHGVVWCSTCGNWYPIEDGLLELLGSALAYVEDRASFWTTHATRLRALGLRQYASCRDQPDLEAQRRQQAHSDWYASNPQQSYMDYEQTPFWLAVDALAFDEWRKEIRPGSWLLDVGCAQGRSTFKIMDLSLRIVAFDISKNLVRQAIARYGREECLSTATFFVADATRFPFVGGRFDYVLLYGVLHHLPDPGATCREIARVLKPGGVYFGGENNRTVFRAGFDLLQRLLPLWYEEAGEQPLASESDFWRWLQPAWCEVSVHTGVFLPPHLFNLLAVDSARRLLRITNRLFGSVPLLRNHGGLIWVRAVRGQGTGLTE